jgi:hypothetical protein
VEEEEGGHGFLAALRECVSGFEAFFELWNNDDGITKAIDIFSRLF